MKTKPDTTWAPYLRLFSEQNRGRRTRLGVFEGDPPMVEDLWIEDGLPLIGIDDDPGGAAGPEIEILLDSGAAGIGHLTRRIRSVSSIRITASLDGEEDGIEVTNIQGETTVLRFERN